VSIYYSGLKNDTCVKEGKNGAVLKFGRSGTKDAPILRFMIVEERKSLWTWFWILLIILLICALSLLIYLIFYRKSKDL